MIAHRAKCYRSLVQHKHYKYRGLYLSILACYTSVKDHLNRDRSIGMAVPKSNRTICRMQARQEWCSLVPRLSPACACLLRDLWPTQKIGGEFYHVSDVMVGTGTVEGRHSPHYQNRLTSDASQPHPLYAKLSFQTVMLLLKREVESSLERYQL